MSLKTFLSRFKRKNVRDAYVSARVRLGLAFQIRQLRKDRRLTQKKLADILNKKQNWISCLEDPYYGNLTVKTLLEVASAFDVALMIKYVPFNRFVKEYQDLSPEALTVPPYKKEAKILSADVPQKTYSSTLNSAGLTNVGIRPTTYVQLGLPVVAFAENKRHDKVVESAAQTTQETSLGGAIQTGNEEELKYA